MPDKPVPGGTRWTRDGIEPANAYWAEAEAYRDALVDLSARITDSELRNEVLQILNKQGVSLNYIKAALHELEIIGMTAKRERLDNGTTQTQAGSG